MLSGNSRIMRKTGFGKFGEMGLLRSTTGMK